MIRELDMREGNALTCGRNLLYAGRVNEVIGAVQLQSGKNRLK